VDVVDTTAAGDACNAGLAVALAEKRSFSDAVQFAMKTSALTVTKAGAQPSLPSRKEVDSFEDKP
jgi:ribokinase